MAFGLAVEAVQVLGHVAAAGLLEHGLVPGEECGAGVGRHVERDGLAVTVRLEGVEVAHNAIPGAPVGVGDVLAAGLEGLGGWEGEEHAV